jgi:hypothetical protein
LERTAADNSNDHTATAFGRASRLPSWVLAITHGGCQGPLAPAAAAAAAAAPPPQAFERGESQLGEELARRIQQEEAVLREKERQRAEAEAAAWCGGSGGCGRHMLRR